MRDKEEREVWKQEGRAKHKYGKTGNWLRFLGRLALCLRASGGQQWWDGRREKAGVAWDLVWY